MKTTMMFNFLQDDDKREQPIGDIWDLLFSIPSTQMITRLGRISSSTS
jgi:hypothetical protein